MTHIELILAFVVGVPVVFILGRLSTRVTWFHTNVEEKYTVPEFIRGRQ